MLNRKVALTILVTALLVSVCFTTATATSERPYFLCDFQHIGNLQQLSVSVPIVVGASLHSNPLDQPTRHEIYIYIEDNPGVHFRGICDDLGLSVGVVQYHLSVLEKAGLTTGYADGQNMRYFEHSAATKMDMKLASLMRHDTTAKILTILAENHSALHRDIANQLGISSQALSWQMNQLKNTGYINAQKEGVNVRYSLADSETGKLVTNLNQQFKI
jgi:predicted transcriptional regulator